MAGKDEAEPKGEAKSAPKKTGNAGTQLGTRKNLPPVSYLLAHGDPETAHLPKTWTEVWGFPMVLSLVFFLSLLTFHYAPHAMSKNPGFQLPQRDPPPMVKPVAHTKEPEPDPELERTDTEL